MGDDEILQLFFHRVEYAISAVEEKYGRLRCARHPEG